MSSSLSRVWIYANILDGQDIKMQVNHDFLPTFLRAHLAKHSQWQHHHSLQPALHTRMALQNCLLSAQKLGPSLRLPSKHSDPFVSKLRTLMTSVHSPMSNGRRIVPSGLFGWLRRRGLIISCFCGLKTGKILSTRIVDAISDGHTKVFCHYQPSRCQFYSKWTRKPLI